MGNQSRRFLARAKENIDRMFKLGGRMEDDEGIIQMMTPTKMSITPKKMTIQEMHIKTVKRLNEKKLLKYLACYIEDDKVILEALI